MPDFQITQGMYVRYWLINVTEEEAITRLEDIRKNQGTHTATLVLLQVVKKI